MWEVSKLKQKLSSPDPHFLVPPPMLDKDACLSLANLACSPLFHACSADLQALKISILDAYDVLPILLQPQRTPIISSCSPYFASF